MGRLSNKCYTQTSTAQPLSRRAEAARNRNKAACKACGDWRRKCDRRPEAGSTCSSCRKRGIDCVQKSLRKTVPDGQIAFVFECTLTGQPETDGRKSEPIDVEALHYRTIEDLTSIPTPTIVQKQDDATDTISTSINFDLCFSPSDTPFHPEDAEPTAVFCHNKLRAETPWEDELINRDADAIIEDDRIELWTQSHSVSQETFEFMDVHGRYILPHVEYVFSIESGPDGLLWVWYIFDGLIFVALRDIELMVVEGPFSCILS